MKVTLLSFASLPAVVYAHDILHHARHVNHAHHARQAPNSAILAASSPAAASGASSAAASAPPAAASGAAPSVTSGALSSSIPTFPPVSVSLESVNPTAVPLSSIVAGAPSQPTIAFSTVPPGTTPTVVPGAPALPALNLDPSQYPPLDKAPDITSPEVQQWIQEVQNSGVNIPNISPTVAGGCPANAQAAADTTRCWWTCGGCTRDTDITTCPDKYTWGLTYDDGPAFYTPNLLSYLDSVNLKSTFFVVGSRVLSNPGMLQAEFAGGHQIAVHTWSHPSLTTLSNEAIIAELGWSKKVIKDVLGVTPNMMRPPYGDIDDRVRAISIAMGLTPVIWTRISPTATFDTDDFDIAGGLTSVGQVLQNWENILGNVSVINTGFIVLEHDLFQQSVDVATGYILPDALAHNPPFSIKPVISCLNMPNSDAYIETNDNKTNPPLVSGSGAVTLSSGAPGSAQATGAAAKGSASSLTGVKVERLGWFAILLAGLLGAGALLN